MISRLKMSPKPTVSKPSGYASLPRWELTLYMAIWIGHALYAIYCVYEASRQHVSHLWGGHFEPGWQLLGSPRKDTSNYEWTTWTKQAIRYLPWYCGHVILFNLAEKPLKWLWQPLMLVYWLIANLYLYYGDFCVVAAIVMAVVMLGVTQLRSRLLMWLTSIGLLFTLAQRPFFEAIAGPLSHNQYYVFVVFFAYKLLQFLSFCENDIKEAASGQTEGFFKRLYKMIWYSFYLPYSISLIVTYHDFTIQMAQRQSVRLDLKAIGFIALRVAFWICMNDLVLHYLFFNAFMTEVVALNYVKMASLPQVASIAFISGQFFHTKYIGIFGFPTVFAKLDGMAPPWPPICISRVALYSRMWRYFDRGLYSFLREMLYLPLVGTSGAFLRRTLATAVCFGFVWLWHGATDYYFVWVGLNFIEVMLENAAKEIYKLPSVRLWFDSHLSPTNFRRFTAVLQVPCVAFGIFSIFYFIGGYEIGHLISGSFVFQGWPWAYLLSLGYPFAQSCIEIELRERQRDSGKLFSTS